MKNSLTAGGAGPASRRPVWAAAVAAAAALMGGAAWAGGQVTFEPVALTGQSAPGTGGATFRSFDLFEYAAGDDRRVGFVANLSTPGTGTGSAQGVFAGRPGALKLLAQTHQRAPGTEEGIFFVGGMNSSDHTFAGLSLGPGGQVGFQGDINAPGEPDFVTHRTLYLARPDDGSPPSLLAREHFPSPAGRTITGFDQVGFGRGGDVVLNVIVQFPEPNEFGREILVGRPGVGGGLDDLRTVARAADPAPGTEPGVTFRAEGMGVVRRLGGMGPSAQALVYSKLRGPGIGPNNFQGVWIGSSIQDLRLLARAGNPAPGLPGVNYAGSDDDDVSVFGVDINAAGQVAVGAELDDGSYALFHGAAGSAADGLRPVLRTGRPAPHVAGRNVEYIFQRVLADTGQLAVSAFLLDQGIPDTEMALYYGLPDDLRLVARTGQQAPDLPAGVNFGNSIFLPQLFPSAEGFVAFADRLTGEGVTEANNDALFATDGAGGLRLVVREGDRFTVGPGDERNVIGIGTTNGPGADGRMLLRLQFADGTRGLFLAAVPEPTGVGIVVGAAFLSARRRTRRAGAWV